MARLGLDFRQIDYQAITHFHPDHVSDLVPLLFALNYTVGFTRSQPLHLIGPPGLKDFYEKLLSIYGRWIEAQTYPLFFYEGGKSLFSFPEFQIETLPMNHSTPTVGFRFNLQGRKLVYSGDTDYCENIVSLGRHADLLILECSFPDSRKVPGHLTPSLAGRIARETSCRRLLLTHFYPLFHGHDIIRECGREFSGEILLAEDGMKLSL
jgi:ribonuclease BN (tRNA processing enzyme)